MHGSGALDMPGVILIKWLLCPLVITASLIGCTLYYEQGFTDHFLLLTILTFLISSNIFDEIDLYRSRSRFPILKAFNGILCKWGLVIGSLLLIGYATKQSGQFSPKLMLSWFLVTPIALLFFQVLARQTIRVFVATKSARTAIIIGATPLGCELQRKISEDPYLGVKVIGFFDDRTPAIPPQEVWGQGNLNGLPERRRQPRERLPQKALNQIIGRLSEVAGYVREHGIDLIYISLPMVAQPRILSLLDELRDTTSSVYFVPDIFMFDLIQARFDQINGVPVVAVCDTPFFGMRGLLKRFSDIMIAGLVLLLISPLMALIAIGVKLGSPGPILFKQRRYGLDGEQISAYKFRSMTVCEDGEKVVQASQNDQRVTPFGKFLRKTSLDELPQFINVLQGSMSVVGPRPHAVAHNELYRKVIKGYMIRHKVKPGITGWAQVNGLRGETDTVEKMSARVQYDLEYLRNWSLMLDLWIFFKTFRVVVGDKNAF
jgi:putative colanic acid biosynthesis UDP-glucose lipid carrier transferase